MIDPNSFLIFLAGALVLNITPGPDMAFTLATSARSGARAGVAAALGVGVGSLGWAVVTALGLAALLASSDHALTIIRVAGGAYLLYLAVNTYRSRREWTSSSGAGNSLQAFRSGALTNLLNPKVGLFYLAFLPTFTDAVLAPIWMQTLFLGGLFSLTGALILVLVAFGAGALRARIARSPAIGSRLNTAAASVFAGLGFYLLFSQNE